MTLVADHRERGEERDHVAALAIAAEETWEVRQALLIAERWAHLWRAAAKMWRRRCSQFAGANEAIAEQLHKLEAEVRHARTYIADVGHREELLLEVRKNLESYGRVVGDAVRAAANGVLPSETVALAKRVIELEELLVEEQHARHKEATARVRLELELERIQAGARIREALDGAFIGEKEPKK